MGQLKAAKKAFDKAGIKSTAIISVAKKPDRAFALSLDKPVDLEDKTPRHCCLKNKGRGAQIRRKFPQKIEGQKADGIPSKENSGHRRKKEACSFKAFW